jgi:hypothetical protein
LNTQLCKTYSESAKYAEEIFQHKIHIKFYKTTYGVFKMGWFTMVTFSIIISNIDETLEMYHLDVLNKYVLKRNVDKMLNIYMKNS